MGRLGSRVSASFQIFAAVGTVLGGKGNCPAGECLEEYVRGGHVHPVHSSCHVQKIQNSSMTEINVILRDTPGHILPEITPGENPPKVAPAKCSDILKANPHF